MNIRAPRLFSRFAKRNKYNAEKIESDGHVFDSKKEFKRYQELRLLERGNEIHSLVVHPRIEVFPGYRFQGRAVRAVYYEPDFSYYESGMHVYEDTKGVRTDVYKLKRKLFLYKIADRARIKFIET